MSKLAEQLRAIKVFNNYELLKRFGSISDVAIEYSRPAAGRAGWGDVHHTSVWSPRDNPKLEKLRRLSSTGSEKTFSGIRKESLPKALAWAKEQFGHEYVPSPHGGYVSEYVLTKAKAAVKGAANASSS